VEGGCAKKFALRVAAGKNKPYICQYRIRKKACQWVKEEGGLDLGKSLVCVQGAVIPHSFSGGVGVGGLSRGWIFILIEGGQKSETTCSGRERGQRFFGGFASEGGKRRLTRKYFVEKTKGGPG